MKTIHNSPCANHRETGFCGVCAARQPIAKGEVRAAYHGGLVDDLAAIRKENRDQAERKRKAYLRYLNGK